MGFDKVDAPDLIAERGEAIFAVLITKGYLFRRPRHLGDKMPIIDCYVELATTPAEPSYFFVQVKTTTQGYTVRNRRLKVGISSDRMQRLAAYPAPTYIVGIDEPQERGYIVSANGEAMTGFSSMCTDHPLNAEVLAALHAEVEAYWRLGPASFKSAFVDPTWRQP